MARRAQTMPSVGPNRASAGRSRLRVSPTVPKSGAPRHHHGRAGESGPFLAACSNGRSHARPNAKASGCHHDAPGTQRPNSLPASVAAHPASRRPTPRSRFTCRSRHKQNKPEHRYRLARREVKRAAAARRRRSSADMDGRISGGYCPVPGGRASLTIAPVCSAIRALSCSTVCSSVHVNSKNRALALL